ncbi:hypothetical protein ELI37_19860 [Rhizobium leguminosarum]|uniref:plasmid recombination protein n=1 Tax=Rhizobium leguminosarum TaxID=384 RepID=UPI0010301F2A|nr:hypothetical protein [Rhizobium leguminosarum]TAV12595.1 hypothetical protein ELI37_19860 [Rhizobium leguminosarum]
MAFQFAHMQSYSRKGDSKGRSVSFVLAEARRDPAASVHVLKPLPPTVIHGVSIDEVERLHDARAEEARTTPHGGKPRRVRQDQHTIMTVVVSHPFKPEEVRADQGKCREIEAWERQNVIWLLKQFGDGLVSVVRHEDESRWHLHAYVLPTLPDMRASILHPGQQAKASIMSSGPRTGEDDKTLNRRGDAAYRSAMRDWQDQYFRAVGAPSGLTRLGPSRRRLQRDEWQAEQTQAQALQIALERAKVIQRQGKDFVQATNAAAASATGKANQFRLAADRAIREARAERSKAASALSEATRAREEAEIAQMAANRLRGIGGRLRAFWDGLRISKIRDAVTLEFTARLDQAQRLLDAARHDIHTEKERRRQAERHAEASASSVRDIAAQRNDAWTEVQHLRASLARHEPRPAENREYRPR